MSFDEQPDDPNPHGECANEIHLLTAKVSELEAENERLVKVMCRDDVKSQIKTFLTIGLCEFVGTFYLSLSHPGTNLVTVVSSEIAGSWILYALYVLYSTVKPRL